MNSRLNVLNSPLVLGFEQLERTLDRLAKVSNDGYPPYNIEQLDEHTLRITLAVAGFGSEDLAIETENNQLKITGKQVKTEEDCQRVFVHRGIASRQFQRTFVLAEGMEVITANLEHGLLHIDLKRPEPKKRTHKITVSDSSSSGLKNSHDKINKME
jgi:HSP20 family molecular chaperone IbpA